MEIEPRVGRPEEKYLVIPYSILVLRKDCFVGPYDFEKVMVKMKCVG